MSLQTHLSQLAAKHEALERELHDAMQSLASDDLRIAELKRKKLHLKDEIERLRGSTPTSGAPAGLAPGDAAGFSSSPDSDQDVTAAWDTSAAVLLSERRAAGKSALSSPSNRPEQPAARGNADVRRPA